MMMRQFSDILYSGRVVKYRRLLLSVVGAESVGFRSLVTDKTNDIGIKGREGMRLR